VHPLDEQAIAQRLEDLLNNPNLCREMGLNGYRAFINKYNWQLEEIKLLSLYEKLLPAKGSNEIV
jgi:glycosyltransferase involved in cell wall biosynthesis